MKECMVGGLLMMTTEHGPHVDNDNKTMRELKESAIFVKRLESKRERGKSERATSRV